MCQLDLSILMIATECSSVNPLNQRILKKERWALSSLHLGMSMSRFDDTYCPTLKSISTTCITKTTPMRAGMCPGGRTPPYNGRWYWQCMTMSSPTLLADSSSFLLYSDSNRFTWMMSPGAKPPTEQDISSRSQTLSTVWSLSTDHLDGGCLTHFTSRGTRENPIIIIWK